MYYTQYHLNFRKKRTYKSIYIGPVKIYSTNDTCTDKAITFNTCLSNLEESFYSVGQTNDYYHRLKHYLGETRFFNFLNKYEI